MRKIFFGLIVVVVVAVAAALIVPSFIDWNSYKAEIAAEVKRATGRDLTINGDLDLSFLPAPSLSADDVHFANMAGATAPEMARLKALRVKIRFAPLLAGRIEVESIALIEPVIELERLADGRANWEFGVAAGQPRADAASPAAAPAGPGPAGIRLDSVNIQGGTLIYRDASEGTVERIENLDLEISARSLSGPFKIAGGLSVRGLALAINASVGNIAGPKPAPVKIGVTLGGGDHRVEITGSLSDVAEAPRLTGKLKVDSVDFGRFLGALAEPGSGFNAPLWAAQPFSLTAAIDGSAKAIAIDGIALRFGETTANGGVNVVLGEKTQADIALRIRRIDLDKLLAAAAPAQPAPSSAESSKTPSVTAATEAGFALPANFNGSLDLGVEAVTFKGGQIRSVRLAASLNEGEVTLEQFTARLPGGAEASLFGFLTAPSGGLSFDGNVDVRADNLRGVLEWLKLDVGAVPPDRLRKFVFSAKLRGTERQIQVSAIKLQFDASRITGGITYALGRARPAFGAQFRVDHLNLDAYLPRDAARGALGANSPESSETTPSPSAAPRAGVSPLAALDTFDANLNLRIGTLNYRRTPIQGVVFDGTLVGGRLTLRDVRVRSIAGTSASIKGTLSGFTGVPAFKGTFSAKSKNVTGLFRVAGIETAFPPRKLGGMTIDGKADAGPDRVTLDAKIRLAGATATLAGRVEGLKQSPRFHLTIDANHPELARLAKLVGLLEAKPAGRKRRLGPFGLSTRVAGDLRLVEVESRIKIAGADVTFNGTVTDPAGALSLDGELHIKHPSVNRLMRTVDPGFRPRGRKLGRLDLAARVKGNRTEIRLERLKGDLGPLRVEGDGGMNFSAKRPKLTASLSAGKIDVDAFLPADSRAKPPSGPAAVVGAPVAGRPGAGGKGAGRYSDAPLDLSALDVMDADINLAAQEITWRTFKVDRPRITVTLKDRLLTIGQLAGKMFGGAFDMTGALDGRATPSVTGKVKIVQANVGKALFEAGNFDIANGIMDFDMTLAATGRSERAMISALHGDGRMAVRNGVVKGFDLKKVSDRLKQLRSATDFLGLFGSAMGGGETRFSSLDGTFQIRKGVVRTSDTKLVAQAGRGEAKGYVDLVRWNMDMEALFRLTEHPDAPPFGMRVTGPPDQPKRLFKFDKMQAYLLGRGASGLIERLTKGRLKGLSGLFGAPGPQPQPAPQQAEPQAQPQPQPQQPKRLSPEDILRGLLQGLGR